MNKGARILFISVLTVIGLIAMMNVFSTTPTMFGGTRPLELQTSEFRQKVEQGQVKVARWQQSRIRGELVDGRTFTARVPMPDTNAGSELEQLLIARAVQYNMEQPPASQAILPVLYLILGPLLIFVLIWMFLIRPAQSGGSQAMSFGKSKAKRAGEVNPKITFDDVAGIEEAKQELYEVVDFLKNTKKYTALGAKIPKGILLTGPPGVGKTHLARAIAGEAGVPFFHISGSDFAEMFVGVGAARVRDLFETAKAHRPCLVFVDEIDAVGRQRGAGLGGGHDEREQTLNQLLVEMDGFEANAGVIVIAATNRPDVLDPALLRPGRFDRHIVVDPPDAKGRELILGIHSKGKPMDESVDLRVIAKRSPGFTGADLANTINEAALLAARKSQSKITIVDIEEALDRVMAGPQRKSRVIEPKEREVIAYHEAGHAIIGEKLEHCDPVHKVTILPRGMSLGSTWAIPDRDTYLESKQHLLDDISMSLGGLVAEQIVYGTTYTGTTGDLERVTRIARAMVTQFGMSEKLGTLAIGKRHRNPFLGRDYSEQRDYSEDVAKMIDEEVRDIVEGCKQRSYELLTSHREQLDRVVQALLDRETLNRDEFLAVLNNQALPEPVGPDSMPVPAEEAPLSAIPAPPPTKQLKPDPA